jgi:biotin carboxyl carrier protein
MAVVDGATIAFDEVFFHDDGNGDARIGAETPSFYFLGHSVISIDGEVFRFVRAGEDVDLTGLDAGDTIIAPLPGKIVAFVTKVGAMVKKGDALVTLEAMKMEHALKAPRDGIVSEVGAAEGAQVKEGAVLVRLEPTA